MNKTDKHFLHILKTSPLLDTTASPEEMLIWLDLVGFTGKDIEKALKILSDVHNLDDDVIVTAPPQSSKIAKMHGSNVIFRWKYASAGIFNSIYALMHEGLLDKHIANDGFKDFVHGMKLKYMKLGYDKRTLDLIDIFADFEEITCQRIAYSHEEHKDGRI